MEKECIVYLDGQFVKKSEAKISVFDHGVLYGDGIFEGIRIYNGKVFRLKDHIDRLYSGAKTIMLDVPVSKEEMMNIVEETCKKNDLKDGYIRLVITRGVGDLGLSPTKCEKPSIFCIATTITLYPKEVVEKGMSIITANIRRNKPTIVDPQIKSLNYLNNILAKIEANRAGAPEALMLNHDGIVAECTGDNIFIVKDGVIYTPPTYLGILDGITRKTVIELAEKNNLKIQEKEFTLYNIYDADECFLTGTAAEVVSVTQLDGRIIGDGKPGKITNHLLDLFQQYINK